MKHNYLEPRADIRFLATEDIIATSGEQLPPLPAEKLPSDDTVNDNF